MKNEDCIFCKIVKGEIPCEKIWEDENTFAFLDVSPATEGHTLVIPKKHYENIFDIPEKVLEEIMKTSQKIAKLLKERLLADGINIFNSNNKVAQQEVFHYHIHIIPRYSRDKFKIVFNDTTKNKELKKIAEKIRGK